ncbi:efflux RND transporter periplasmic adaptor subunit [Luteimonas weifangensis]|uniref:Efflux RND transporter periplasmic adaptor subunit n=2 Tax=Cognatiluteimonas weifangensis TaxID=2303539 RepID=A0A372DQZ8_9GAMM|nr:efflux RND transporter periplasmic adaptor subunit [Luteimonas weifangensis]
MTRMRTTLAAALLAALAACGGEPATPALPPLPQLQTLTVQATAGPGRAWDGVVEAVRQADLSAQTAGRVTAVVVDVDDRVGAGQVLLRLTAVEQQAGADTARAQLRAAEAAAAEAAANYRRYAALAEGRYVSKSQLDQVRAARDSAVAARDAARAQLAQAGQQTAYTVVRAPFAGVVSARRVEPGESIAPGQPLLSVYAPGALRIEVQVPQSDADAVRKTGRARIVLADGRSVDAAQVVVFPTADPATHSVGVRVTLPDVAPAPAPGSTAKVVFPPTAGEAPPAVDIPVSALVQRGEVSGVYVLAGDRLSLRQLRLGQRSGDRVEVLAGLRRGETIAADPVAAVQALVAQRRAAAGAGDD